MVAIDLEVDTEDLDAIVACVRYLDSSFGGIDLEDIKALLLRHRKAPARTHGHSRPSR